MVRISTEKTFELLLHAKESTFYGDKNGENWFLILWYPRSVMHIKIRYGAEFDSLQRIWVIA